MRNREPGDAASISTRRRLHWTKLHLNQVKLGQRAKKQGDVMLLRGSILAFAVALATSSGADGAVAQGVFTLTSPSFGDGHRLAVKNAGNIKGNPNCIGQNISPAL